MDLTEAQWAFVNSIIPEGKPGGLSQRVPGIEKGEQIFELLNGVSLRFVVSSRSGGSFGGRYFE
jgi:hypothetical protein